MSLRWLTNFTFSALFDKVLRRFEKPQKGIIYFWRKYSYSNYKDYGFHSSMENNKFLK
ncbi:unnamed protein product [Brassica rapa subsp. narinosa]